MFDDGIFHHPGQIAEEVAQPGEGRLRVGCAEGAFVDFGDGNDADGEALAAEAIQGALRSWPTDRGIDEPIGIDQRERDGRVIGRVPSSRPR